MVGSQQDHAREVFAQPTNDSTATMGIQNQSVSYFDNASGYLVSPLTDRFFKSDLKTLTVNINYLA
ncbi:MAG: hypothetical protein GEU26_12070 [Nitrososphaeraceae archaeon]|nr:hypothetical protein [Nitrososphaeraceae archaeon]